MSHVRVVAAACGGEGHLGPLLPFLSVARDAGDDVSVVVPPSLVETVEASGLRAVVTATPDARRVSAIRDAMQTADRAERVRLSELELFGTAHTEAAMPVMRSWLADWPCDLVLRESCDYASAVCAQSMGIPVATVAISPGRADAAGTRIASAVVEQRAPGTTDRILRSPYLTRFPDDDSGFSDTRRYGFGSAPQRASRSTGRLMWLTFGTVTGSFAVVAETTWRTALDAVAELPCRVVASVGRGGARHAHAGNVDLVDWVDAADILRRADIVVCHGGSGTTFAALAAGVPLVVVPMFADQPVNAAIVEQLGVGLVVRPPDGPGITGLGPADRDRLRDAMSAVLAEPRFREAASAAATGFAAAPTVAERWEQLRR